MHQQISIKEQYWKPATSTVCGLGRQIKIIAVQNDCSVDKKMMVEFKAKMSQESKAGITKFVDFSEDDKSKMM